MKNPALSQELRYEPATVIPLKNKSSLLDWLQAEGRLIPREVQETPLSADGEEEISELMDVDEANYDDDDDDDDDDVEEVAS